MTTRPTLYPCRDREIVATYEPANPHPVPIPAADVVEAVAVLRRALDHWGDLGAEFLEGVYSAYGPVTAALGTLFRYSYEWDQRTAHIPFQDVEQIVRTLLDLSGWQYDGCEVPPGRYQEIAAEIALAHRLTLALDAYDVATYAVDGEESAMEGETAPTATPPSSAPREPEHDLVSAFWALSQALRAEGKHPEVIAKDAVAHLEATRAAAP